MGTFLKVRIDLIETKFPKKIKFYNDLEKHIKKLKKKEEESYNYGRF